MKKIHSILLLLLVVIASSCSSMLVSNNQLMKIRKGMTSKEVVAVLGKPDYRRFDEQMEVWEFHRFMGGVGPSVVAVQFIDDRVTGLDTFEDLSSTSKSCDNPRAHKP